MIDLKSLKVYIFILFGALILMFDAFLNGYPILYQDSSTYIANGFDIGTPIDKPITYCLFVRLFSLNGFTLWTVILAQAYLLSYLIFKLLETLFGKEMNPLISLAVIVFISFFTGASWTVSQLIADIFTSIAILVLTIILISKPGKIQLYFYYFLFLLSTSMHLSHILINLAMLLVISILRPLPFLHLKTKIKVRTLFALLGMSYFVKNYQNQKKLN